MVYYTRLFQEAAIGNIYNTKYGPNSSTFSDRPTKPHVTAVPDMLTAEGEAL